ncbi:MAG TPA: DUF4118 domain-containing protein [Actinomycetes bacterium]|nr:DUF4118 domain-containing protein [Actinomycetes bacterium]
MQTRWPLRDRIALLGALLGPLLVTAALVPFRGHVANTNAALVLVLVVVAVAANGNRVAGVVAAISSGVWFDVLLTKPYGHLTITNRADVWTTVLLLAVGVAVTEIAWWGRKSYARAERDAAYLAGIRAAAEAATSGTSASAVLTQVGSELTRVLGLSECRFERGVAGVGSPVRLRPDAELEWHGRLLPDDAAPLPVDEVELVVERGGALRGRYLMRARSGSHPSREQREVAVALANQVAAILS